MNSLQLKASRLFLLAAFFFRACSILPFASAQDQGEQISDLPLYITSRVHCDDMIYLHRWEGDCCSLNVTAGNGCVLNVMNGYCKVYGQEWTLEYTSTYDEKDCPGSEYLPSELGIKEVKDNASDQSSGVRWTTAILGSLGLVASVLLLE